MQASQLPQILKDLSSPSNEARNLAESAIKDMRHHQASELFNQMALFITQPSVDLNSNLLACLLLKKYFLDDRAEERDLVQITTDQARSLKTGL
jgi:hypothetical protein